MTPTPPAGPARPPSAASPSSAAPALIVEEKQ
ncbi:hypothetical protein FHX41_1799 [Actinomadura hallensis]|uniref:Uncharacterized protein n=1 Tax=Actinomadura hallensis TaxID=337895 RepID=A0A543IC65_9ACTN|nr:hypothetical protein FHX41_1799 [Actinomadura hallensis]